MVRKARETHHRLGELLVRRKLVKSEEIDEALALQRSHIEQRRDPPKLGEILKQRNLLNRATIQSILEEQKISRGQKRVLKLGLEEEQGIAVLSLRGRLDKSTEAGMTRTLERLMNRGIIQLVVDASDLLQLDSHGASSFVAYVDETRARGGDVKFFGLKPEGRFTLERLGLLSFLQVFDTKKDAVQAFSLPIDEYLSRGSLGEYVAAEESRHYHLSYCPLVQKTTDDLRVYYESKWHARRDGKTPCNRCRP